MVLQASISIHQKATTNRNKPLLIETLLLLVVAVVGSTIYVGYLKGVCP